MKRTLRRIAQYKNQSLNFEFEYWPPYHGDRENPPEPPEINLVSITDASGNNLLIPDFEEKEYQEITNLLLNLLAEEQIAAEAAYDNEAE